MSQTFWYGSAFTRAFTELAAGGGAAKTWKVALLDGDYTYDATHDYFSDVSAEEVAGGGYTAGGGTLSNVTLTFDSAAEQFIIDADDWAPVGVAVEARYAVVYLDTGTAATSPLISCTDLTEDDTELLEVSGLAMHPSGMLTVSVITSGE